MMPSTRCRVQMLSLIAVLAGAGCAGTAGQTEMAPVVNSQVQRAEVPRIREFNDLLGGSSYGGYYAPSALVAGPNRDLWVADNIDQDFGECAVVQIASSGRRINIFYYSGLISEGAYFADVTLGPDGALWISDSYNQQILRLTPDGKYTGYQLGYSGNFPEGIAAGPDGALWFAGYQHGLAAIGRITTSGKVRFFTSGLTPSTSLQDIAAAPDGAMWFTEPSNDRIGRITMRGKITEFSNGITAGAEPYAITAGPDGALWFTEKAGRIGRITTKGSVTEYSQGITQGEEPSGITAGHDALWFTETEVSGSYLYHDAKIGRITTNGSISEYSGLTSQSNPTDIVVGPRRALWFVESGIDELGRITF